MQKTIKYHRIKFRQEYKINEGGEITTEKGRILKAYKRNKTDKHLSVNLQTADGKKRNYPVRYLMLHTFSGIRDKEWKCGFIDNNQKNIKRNNIYWELKPCIDLWTLLSDCEFELWKKKIFRIKDIAQIKKHNEIWLRKYIQWNLHNYGKDNYEKARKQFIKKLFK